MAEIAIAPAPVTPSPAPAPTPPPAPGPEPSNNAPDASQDDFDKQMDTLSAKRKPAPVATKPEDKTDKPTDKPGDKPADKKPLEPKALRAEYEKTTADLKAERERIAKLEVRIAEAETKGADTTKLAEQLAAREAELKTLQSELRAAKQELSPEFVDKYQKPFQKAATYAERMIEQLQVGKVVPPEDGEGPGQWQPERKASWLKDFAPLYQLDYAEAKARAKALFGEDASVVMDHYQQLHRLNYEKEEALGEEKKNAVERQKADQEREVREREAIQQTYVKVNTDVADKHPQFFKDVPDDAEGNKLLKSGFDLVDAKPDTWQKKVTKDAHVRLRAAAFPRLVHWINQKDERIAELEGKLKEAKGSEPGDTKRPGGSDAAPKEKGWKEAMKEEVANA